MEKDEVLPDTPSYNEALSQRSTSVWKRFAVGSSDASAENETKRAMQSRHLMMIAIGGTIGTGIFLSAGSAIALAGPGSALLSYFIVGVFVYSVVISLGEMSAMFPVSGAFSVFGTRFVSPALGFTLGWNYWFQCELTAAAIILQASWLIFTCTENIADRTFHQYWAPQVQAWEWALAIIVPVFLLQLIHVRVYGESEYWFALVKVLMIIVFIFVGLIYDWGGVKGHPGPGLSNFHNGQAFIGGFENFAQTFVYAFYSFGGVELVAVAAGESAQPHKTVPRAIKATFFRIVLFYILTILTIGLCINWQDPTLLSAAYDSDVTASPLTVVFQRAGFGAAAHVVNAVLLTAVLSATNSCFYASSRMLLSLARSGQAPRIFGWVNSRGVPVPALLMSLAVSFITFLTTIWGEGIVFTWLVNLTGISALLVWGSIGLISLRFRMAYRAQGRSLSDLPYTQPFFPLLPAGVVVLAILMFIAEGYSAVKEQPFEAKNVAATYIGVALYIVLYIGYTLYERFWRGIRQYFVPLLEVDLETDAVWKAGEGAMIRDRESKNEEGATVLTARGWRTWLSYTAKHVY
ncbi:amino acid permease/ SLC12A domain-containing protein [Suillus paluster]|uniref:amino acid permease/ SLC12A domain-containing protein n=1 Tax=Suillus paluster TaxID=48578 RepID=UPI001B867BDF|nr:amino acid permease/ SLC12A domain-containing protein [Suillus paluster]KAG1736432.1 amino acid permease/ SLC12A domain-containing protein [Suillus paluster]